MSSLEQLASTIAQQTAGLSVGGSAGTGGTRKLDEFGLQAMQKQNFPVGNQGMPPQMAQAPMTSLRGQADMGRAQRARGVPAKRPLANRFEKRAIEFEEKAQAQQQQKAHKEGMQRADQVYMIARDMMGEEQARALAQAAQQNPEIHQKFMEQIGDPVEGNSLDRKQEIDVSRAFYADAKPMVAGYTEARYQFNILETLATEGWKGQGAGQVAALYSFIKSLDPDTAVREGEVRLAQQAESMINNLLAKYEGITENTLMSEDMFKDVMDLTQNLNRISRESYRTVYNMHKERIEANDIDPIKVFGKTFMQGMEGGAAKSTSYKLISDAEPKEEKPDDTDSLKARLEALGG